MALPNPVIVIPGITANYLSDQYSLPPENIWTPLVRDFDRSALHPDDKRYEAVEPARVAPGQLFEVCYKELIEELRYNLRETEDLPVPVFPFSYDWRQPLAETERSLADFVNEVISRTGLLRHYHRDPWRQAPKVNLVGHSMGGLIIAGYLQGRGAASQVGKVATIAAPFKGSFESVIKVVTGTANLGVSAPSSREREAARMTPALYHLLPERIEELDLPPPFGSLFEVDVWQPSILETIAEYIRLRGLGEGDAQAQARLALKSMLDDGLGHRQRLTDFALANAGLQTDDWLCIVGSDAETRVALRVIRNPADQLPQFDFRSADRSNEWGSRTIAKRWLTGDGTVHLRGAVPAFLPPESLVCVTPDDFGYWELVDRGLARASGFHGFMPTMDMLHRMIVRHFTGRPERNKNTWGSPLPGIGRDWKPPLPLDQK